MIVSAMERDVVPNGVLLSERADAWILSTRWTVVATLEQPIEPPILVWIGSVVDRLRVAGRDVSADHRSALRTRLDRLRLLYSQQPQPTSTSRHRRGLINFIGGLSSSLFGVATEGQVRAVAQQVENAQRSIDVLFHNQDKLVSVLNATREQAVQNHGDILTLASNLSSLTDKANLLAWQVGKLDVLHRFLHLVDQLDQISFMIQLRRRWYLAACEAMRSGHLSRDVMSDVRLGEVLSLLSERGYIMAKEWYRAYTPVQTVWDTQKSFVSTFTLWAANREQYILWSLRSLWFMNGDLVMRYQVRPTMLTDRAHSVQYTPAKCRGHGHQVCLVSQTGRDDCELTVVQGMPVSCKYDVAKSAPPRLEYLSSDMWLVAVTHCVNLTVRCPGLPPSDFAVCQPERWNISSQCIIEWPFGKTIPVGQRFLSVRPRYFAPLTWRNVDIPVVQREQFHHALSIHASLVVDPNADLTMEAPPKRTPMTIDIWRVSSMLPLLGIIVTVVTILVCCYRRRTCCFAYCRSSPHVEQPPAPQALHPGTRPAVSLYPALQDSSTSAPVDRSGPAVPWTLSSVSPSLDAKNMFSAK